MAKVLASTKDLSREEWLKLRQLGIGGSDVSVILGFNKWKSPFQLYVEKTSETVEEINNEFVYWGNKLEDVVADEFATRTGKKVQRVNKMLQHDEHEFLLANIDRRVVGESSLLECKTTSTYNKAAWEGDNVPAEYLCQVQYYLAITGYEKAYIAVLIGGNEFVWKEIQRDNEFINLMLVKVIHFWNEHILAKIPPAIDGSTSATEFLKKMYSDTNSDEEVELSNDSNALIEAISSIKEEIKRLETQQKEYENNLKLQLKNAEKGISTKFIVSYKSVTSNRLDSKKLAAEHPKLYEEYCEPSFSRRLNIKEIN